MKNHPSTSLRVRLHFMLSGVEAFCPNLLSGYLFHLDSTGDSYIAEEVNNLSSKLKAGLYKIQGHFHPTPQTYWSDTDTLTFRVE